MKFDQKYILTNLSEDDTSLISAHYINEVLPTTKQYKEFHMNRLMAIVDNPKMPLSAVFESSKNLKERPIEDALIKPILESLGNRLRAQVSLNGDAVDFCVFTPDDNIKPDGFAEDYVNTTTIVESKRYGRIENKYYIQKKDNTDEIYQTLNYLNVMNLTLAHAKHANRVSFAVLTDGYRWRIYSKNYTHNIKEYESHFIEFDLEAIVNCSDIVQRNHLLKLFGIFFSKESLAGELAKHQKASGELETAVTVALKEQTYTSLEYIATGIWRVITDDENPLMISTLEKYYGIDVDKVKNDEEERARLLKIIYDESLVFLLRMLFVLYAEDRNLFDQKEIPKVIKGENNILDLIISKNKGIGEITDSDGLNREDDLKLGAIYRKIDKKYNGGLFSGKKHPLLFGLNIDDTLFANAVDNLCRVQVKKQVYTVDFSTISVRELGSIYESLLEYKLAVIDKDMKELPSIINKKRVRHNVARGDLYLINHAGERKATGSYYTPDLIVEHLVKTALNPKLEEAKKAYPDDFNGLFKAVLNIKVCDPAMGSGHMIQACYSRIIAFLRQAMEEMYSAGNKDAVWTSEFEYRVRTQVARKCIYGVDLNPYAVEIAKLVLWMKVFNRDKPFEFFDYNLACGNSLIGVYEKIEIRNEADQMALFWTQEEMETDIQTKLLRYVSHMIDMPRDSIEAIHEVERFYQEEVRPLQHQVAFAYNVKIAHWLLPEKKEVLENGYELLLNGVVSDSRYVEKVFKDDASIPDAVKALKEIDKEIQERFNPLHWSVAYPHIAVKGGFDVILSNPPWDKIKSNHNEFFSDYIIGYGDMEASVAKNLANDLMENNPNVKLKWNRYLQNIDSQNSFYQKSYMYQTYKDSNNEVLSGDANLYKVFLEKIFTILIENGMCGIVIPDNLNIDSGCAGLRHMLLENATIKQLIMFENRKKLFDIDVRYKYDVLTFQKSKPRSNAVFEAGFYWYDPIWLDGEPDNEYVDKNRWNKKQYHNTYSYSTPFISKTNPDLLTIYEFKNQRILDIFEKINTFPGIGDVGQSFYIKSFNEFHMTHDSDLFNNDNIGWPLLQGKTVYYYNSNYCPIDRWVNVDDGETRLSKKWKKDKKELPDRQYRIAWRSIANATNERTLVSTVIPRGVFCGNSLYEAQVYQDGQLSFDYALMSGINVILSSFSADICIRIRGSMNVNAFMVKAIPVPRDVELIQSLGQLALPLYDGDEFEVFRGEISAISDTEERFKLMAKLDSRVAIMYGLTYEDYQFVLNQFPLVDEQYKKRCLMAYNEWKFSM